MRIIPSLPVAEEQISFLGSFTSLFSSCYKNYTDDKLPGLEVCRELHQPHPGCSTALLIRGQRRLHVLLVDKQEELLLKSLRFEASLSLQKVTSEGGGLTEKLDGLTEKLPP